MSEEKKVEITEEESKLTKQILKIIANSDIQLGARDIEQEPERYKETAMQIIKLLHKANILEAEVELIKQLMVQATSIAINAVIGSIELSKDIALTNFWGKHPEEVTLQDIDKMMKKKVSEAIGDK